MKKFDLKKLLASVAALSVVACMTAVPTFADENSDVAADGSSVADSEVTGDESTGGEESTGDESTGGEESTGDESTGGKESTGDESTGAEESTGGAGEEAVSLKVESEADAAVALEMTQVTMTLDELKAADYKVPIYVTLTTNPGLDAIEYGFTVGDNVASFDIINDPIKASTAGYDLVTGGMTINPNSDNPNMNWATWAAAENNADLSGMIIIELTLPEDAAEGDVYEVNFEEVGTSAGGAPSTMFFEQATDEGKVNQTYFLQNGFVKIEEPEAPTEAPTEAPSDEPSSEEEPSSEAPADSKDDSTGAPPTGSSDVLPIAGAAAAVAVLGGVAFVAKKKD